jgi:hypothetical protein
MDRTTKTAIKKLVLTLRQLLEEDIEVVLKRYGLFTDRTWLSADKIPKADEEILAARRRMQASIAVEQARGLRPGQATRWYIREVAFTYLNRLVGLKCLEVRGLIEEVITTRVEYGGRSLFHRDFRHAHPELAAQPDDALPAALEAACRYVTDQMIGVLFDPDSESSVVWPRYQTLRRAIALVNELPAEVWAEDEIIGWVYQFYNAEEKESIRKRGKPRLPIEVAVINQFFTPRWVVKFLVDNTLGRLWLEMHPDSVRVRAKCDYLVPEPLPIDDLRLTIDEKQPTEKNRKSEIQNPKSFQLDPDSPINNPDVPPRRDAKLVTEIRLIDPACGTMHFGYYAFEVFQEMYLDSLDRGWLIGETIDDLRLTIDESQVGEEIVNRQSKIENHEIPALILRHNLYGVDIDLRAIQLAALSLYMKARAAQLAASREPSVRTGTRNSEPVTRNWTVNLVCADARLTNGQVRARFLKEYEDDPALQKVWRELFREMEDIAQVGSLLRVEERFRQLLQAYRPASVALDAERQLGLDSLPQPPRQMRLAEAPGGDVWSPRRTLAEMLEHLRRFARDALEEADVNAQLFAVEAEKTLGLLDVLLEDYDVAVMNPPYGRTIASAKTYIDSTYQSTKNDLYAAFFERATDFLARGQGYVGALTSRTYLQLPTFEKLRREILLERGKPVAIADLGFNVLDDAVVETAASVYRVSSRSAKDSIVFIDLTQSPEAERRDELLHNINLLHRLQPSVSTHLMKASTVQHLPRNVFAYWAPTSLIDGFRLLPAMSDTLAVAKTGLQTDNDALYVRNHWEVPRDHRGRGKRWVPFAKGGDYSKYYSDVHLVVDWEGDGHRIKSAAEDKWGSASKIVRNEDRYFCEGMSYPATTVKGFNVRYLPTDSVFGLKGPGIFPFNHNDLWYALGLLNSSLIFAMLRMLTPSRSFDVTAIGLLPVKHATSEERSIIAYFSKASHDLKAAWDTGNEICTRFSQPWLLQLAHPEGDAFAQGLGCVLELLGNAASSLPGTSSLSIKNLLDQVRVIERVADTKLQELQAQIDEAVYELYDISPADRALIERELGERPPELVWPQMEGKPDKEKRREHVRRLLSYFILQALKDHPAGVLPLVEGAGELTALKRLRERLEVAFGADVAFRLEDEAGRVLGKPIASWLDGDFSQWHTKLYKRRPVIWHIASPRGTFGAFVYYHKLDRDTLRKVRNVYLRTLRDGLGRELEAARSDQDYKAVDRLESALDDLTVLAERLERVIEAGYDPVIGDGVKANILPLQEAGVLRHKKVV